MVLLTGSPTQPPTVSNREWPCGPVNRLSYTAPYSQQWGGGGLPELLLYFSCHGHLSRPSHSTVKINVHCSTPSIDQKHLGLNDHSTITLVWITVNWNSSHIIIKTSYLSTTCLLRLSPVSLCMCWHILLITALLLHVPNTGLILNKSFIIRIIVITCKSL